MDKRPVAADMFNVVLLKGKAVMGVVQRAANSNQVDVKNWRETRSLIFR